MAVQDKFEVPIAYNPAGNGGDGELVGGAEFQVFDIADSSFSTPLAVFDPATGVTINPLRSSAVGVLPDFQVAGARREVLVRSGSFVTRLTSKYGVVFEAGLDPATVQASIAAGSQAEAARVAAVAAKTAAEAAAADVAGVVATNDGIMTAVLDNPESAFSTELSATFAQAGELAAATINPVARGAVADYTGRIGVTGTGTDARAAIQAALTAASSLAASDYYAYLQRRSYTVVLPAGDYVVTAPAAGSPSLVVPAGVTFDFSAATIYTDYPTVASGKWCAIQVEQYGNVVVGKLVNSKRVAAPSSARVYDGIRLVLTDNQTRAIGYRDSEVNGYQGAAIRGIAAWISHVQGLRFVSCSYGYIASNVNDGGSFYGITVRGVGGGTVTNRVHTDLWIKDCQFVNLTHGGVLGAVQGNAAHPNDADYSQSGLQLYLQNSILENIGARALQIYNAFVVSLDNCGVEEVGETGAGMMAFDTVRSLTFRNIRVNLAGRSVPGPSGNVAPFPAQIFELANVQVLIGSGASYVHNSYNAALQLVNAMPPKFDIDPIHTDSLALPIGTTRRNSVTGCRLRRTTNLTVTTSSTTAIPFTAEDWDSDAFHDNSTNPSRITIPTGYQGKYEVNAGIAFASNSTGRRTLIVRLNGSTSIVRDNRAAPASGDASITVATKLSLSAGDYIEVLAYHEAGVDLALDVTTLGAAAAWCTLERIGD